MLDHVDGALDVPVEFGKIALKSRHKKSCAPSDRSSSSGLSATDVAFQSRIPTGGRAVVKANGVVQSVGAYLVGNYFAFEIPAGGI